MMDVSASKDALATKSGIQTSADGQSYIPSSKRADGSTRKEIRVRPGYKPPEDVEVYKNRSVDAWKHRGSGGVPGAEGLNVTSKTAVEVKNKNAKRREAAKKKTGEAVSSEDNLVSAMQNQQIAEREKLVGDWNNPSKLAGNPVAADTEDSERSKKIRNQLKKLRALRELKSKKIAGEKLSHDQLMKISKESELLRDLSKLGYDGPEMKGGEEDQSSSREADAAEQEHG